MMIKTKYYLQASTLTTITKHAFGDDSVSRLVHSYSDRRCSYRELDNGGFASIYRIILRDGRHVILKLAPPPDVRVLSCEKNITCTEVQTLRLIREHTDIPVPEVYFYDDSRTVLPIPYFFMEEIHGYDMEPSDEMYRKVGEYAKQYHAITNDYFGFPGNPATHSDNWYDTVRAMFELLLADAEESPLGLDELANEILEAVEHCQKALDEVTVPRLVHRDLWEGNILADNGKITGFLDFERALWGDILFDIFLVNTAPASLHEDGREIFTENEYRRIMLYCLYYDLTVCTEKFYRYGKTILSENNFTILRNSIREVLDS